MEKPYLKREIDQLIKTLDDNQAARTESLHQRMDTFEVATSETLQEMSDTQNKTLTQVEYTNGKVRKLIIALVLIAGIVIGQMVKSPEELIKLIAHVV